MKYPDSQVLFTSGKAAIYPTGSWEISVFEKDATFTDGHLPAPRCRQAGDTCYISDHTDIAMGMNAATKHPEEAKTFLSWVAVQRICRAVQQRPARLLQPLERDDRRWRIRWPRSS